MVSERNTTNSFNCYQFAHEILKELWNNKKVKSIFYSDVHVCNNVMWLQMMLHQVVPVELQRAT